MRLLLMVAVVVVATGCSPVYQSRGGRSLPLDQIETWKHEIDYELLGHVTAQACAASSADSAKRGSSKDPSANGPRALFEQAKVAALAGGRDLDGLIAVRTVVTEQNGTVCVKVTGRAYRIARLRAVATPNDLPPPKSPAAIDLLTPNE